MPSYLLKNRNGNYYTRVPFPQELKQLGCPLELRISLFTKDFVMARLRNLVAAHGIKQLIEEFRVNEVLKLKIATKRAHINFRELLEPELERLREQMRNAHLMRIDANKRANELHMQLASERNKSSQIKRKAKTALEHARAERKTVETIQHKIAGVNEQVGMGRLQAEFIQRKEGDGISQRSVQQLRTRTDALVKFVGEDFLAHELRFKHADDFIRDLTANKELSEKTVREYKSACSQMIGFAIRMEYTSKNPFEHIKVKNAGATSRKRWARPDLKVLFSSENFTQHAYNNVDDFWTPLLLLHTGARPAEICQLKTDDVVIKGSIPCLSITDEGEDQSIKTANAKRLVPIHSKLLELGFLHFVEQRRRQGSEQLFTNKATGKYGEWAKNFERRFDRYLKKLGYVAGQRPTAYGFRHAIVDELQQLDAPEHVVADLVGHSKKGFTYRHYGKGTPVQRLQKVIEQLDFTDELAAVRKPYLT